MEGESRIPPDQQELLVAFGKLLDDGLDISVALRLAGQWTVGDKPDHIAVAREHYVDDDLEIDDFPLVVSSGEDGDEGIWVAAWVWVPDRWVHSGSDEEE